MWKLQVIVLMLLGLAEAAVRPRPVFHYRKRADVGGGSFDFQAAFKAANVLAETVKLPLDHFGRYPGTYQNRYWVLHEFYKPGSPVFVYDGGESDAEPIAQSRLVNKTSSFRQMVQEFNGIGIVWEHRYYGTSLPANLSLDSAEGFRWLTTAQALADIPAFANNFTLRNYSRTDLTPASTPWVFVGGSYPGIRAALVREKYPETIFASLSSSAPVHAQIDMSVYWEQVYRGLNAMGFKNCSKDLVAVTKYIDDQLARENTAAALKKQYLGAGADNNTDENFAISLKTLYNGWQDTLIEGSPGLRSFCDWISTDPETGDVSGQEGWAKKKGAKFTSDRWATWEPFGVLINEKLNTSCAGYYGNSTSGTPDCRLDGSGLDTDLNSISWMYQYCTEWGFFQSANLGPNQIVSSYYSAQLVQDSCHQLFPDGLSSGLMPEQPDVDKTNREFGDWNLRPSNVFNTGGEFDPWVTLSLLSEEPWAPKGVKVTQNIPEEGVSTSKAEVFGYLLKGAGHCFDLGETWPEGAKVRKIFTTALRKWLKNFKKAY